MKKKEKKTRSNRCFFEFSNHFLASIFCRYSYLYESETTMDDDEYRRYGDSTMLEPIIEQQDEEVILRNVQFEFKARKNNLF